MGGITKDLSDGFSTAREAWLSLSAHDLELPEATVNKTDQAKWSSSRAKL